MTPDDVPNPGAPWEQIIEFAHTFDAYEALGSFEASAEIANSRRHESLTDLRTCLFFEARRWRHFGEDPEGEDLAYIQSVVEKIRAKVSRWIATDFAAPSSVSPSATPSAQPSSSARAAHSRR